MDDQKYDKEYNQEHNQLDNSYQYQYQYQYQYKDDEQYNQLENDWINEFEKVDKDYQGFYNEDLHFLKIHSIYINLQNEVQQIKEEKMFFYEGVNKISREQLLGILKVNSFNGGIKYTILSMLKYNVDIHSSEIIDYLKSSAKGSDEGFLSVIKNIDDIVFNKTINMFQHLNDLILLFYEKSPEEQHSGNLVPNLHPLSKSSATSLTKKVYIYSNNGQKKKHRYTNKYRKIT